MFVHLLSLFWMRWCLFDPLMVFLVRRYVYAAVVCVFVVSSLVLKTVT